MSVQRRLAALTGVFVVLVLATGRRLDAQILSMNITRDGDSIPAAPQVTVTATGLPAAAGPVTLRLEVARDATFQSPIHVDGKQTESAIFTLPQLLPERTLIFFRASAIGQVGQTLAATTMSLPVRSWLRLVSPNRLTNNLFNRRPQFVWNVSSLTLPPGPWSFDISIINAATNQVDFFAPLGASDTTFTFPQPLEANTSYRWRVHARAVNSNVNDEITVQSLGSFVIQSSDQPTRTIFYQNFPNPFPTDRSPFTCFWFDLAQSTTVRLTIYDLRLREVRNIIPGALESNLPAGAYGRTTDQTQTCDNRIIWDGTDDRGHIVPRGVYIARFQAGSLSDTKKILFLGR